MTVPSVFPQPAQDLYSVESLSSAYLVVGDAVPVLSFHPARASPEEMSQLILGEKSLM